MCSICKTHKGDSFSQFCLHTTITQKTLLHHHIKANTISLQYAKENRLVHIGYLQYRIKRMQIGTNFLCLFLNYWETLSNIAFETLLVNMTIFCCPRYHKQSNLPKNFHATSIIVFNIQRSNVPFSCKQELYLVHQPYPPSLPK